MFICTSLVTLTRWENLLDEIITFHDAMSKVGLTFNTHILIRHRWQDLNFLLCANVSRVYVEKLSFVELDKTFFFRWLDRRLRYSHLTNHPELRWLFASLHWNKVKITFLQRFQRKKKHFFVSLEGESWFSDRIWTPNIYIANEVLKIKKPIYNPNDLARRLQAMWCL